MAAAAAICGARAVFYVPFAMGIVLVAVSCWIAFRITRDRTAALAAGAAVSMHPVVFAYAIQAMSDVPAAAWYLLAGALLMSNRLPLAAFAGISASAALLTRPALVPGVLALSVIPIFCGKGRLARLAVFGGLVAAGIGVQSWAQWYLYGSPLANGYGTFDELFSARFIWPNVRSYAYWALLMHGVIWVVALTRGLFVVHDRPTRALLLASLAAAIVPYAVYRTYDHWETLRFVLPLLVMLTIVAVVGVFHIAGRYAPPHVATWLGVALTIAMAAMWARWLEHEQVLGLARVEERYARAGELVARATPENAVVLSSLHSGSLRYYAQRQTVDWARIPPDALDATVAALASHGHPVYLMFDGQQEQQLFEARHGNVINRQRWLPAGQRRDLRLYEAPR
jgi:4-amino-4-deoxy-L-arabinose transferase-like glycosyltransferase